MEVLHWQWVIMIGISVALFFISPWAEKVDDFFKGTNKDKQTNTLFLTSSLVIGWLFAKSITNAADLGYKFGFVGSVAYAAYYLSFIVAGIVIYKMRTKGNYLSIHHFLEDKYGKGAIVIFTTLIGIRLMNEIWSNTMVIGLYFGEHGSSGFYLSVFVFTILTLAYTLKGGMRSSITTDVIQMSLFVLLLILILGKIIPNTNGNIASLIKTGTWNSENGLNLLFVALIQIMSYPFHDPVMTDRGFITKPKITLYSYILAGFIGVLCILLFSLVGIFGGINNFGSPVIAEVSKFFGIGFLLIINTIMLTSAASTIDSTFTSTTKLVHLDIMKSKLTKISSARITMSIIAIVGTIPILFNPDILSATTISGTIVLGLAPIFLFWGIDAPKLSFYGPVLTGILFGIATIFFPLPTEMLISNGPYADLLSVNVIATILCFILFFIPIIYQKYVKKAH